MELSRTDMKMMIEECVKRILEVHGAIDDSLRELAMIILDRLKTEKSFTLSREEINHHYPYSIISKPLNVIRCSLDKATASYNPTSNTLKVSPITQIFKNEYLLEVLMHELTHFVNNTESDEGFLRHGYPRFGNEENEEIVKQIAYLFDLSEMSARITQFKWYIRAKKQSNHPSLKLESYENVTRLGEMRDLIKAVENDSFPESEEESLSIIELLLYRRAFHKTNLDGKDRELNASKTDFEKAKKAIVKKLKMAYKSYFTKISKIYYDEIG